MVAKTQTFPASKVGMYQVHGNHIEAVMEPKDFLINHLRCVIQQAKLVDETTTEVAMDDLEPVVTKVASLSYGDEQLGFSIIIAHDKEGKTNKVITFFPYYCVKKMVVRVETVWIWDNLVEATVRCSYGDFRFSFFAADYFAHKDTYVPGNEIEISIGAMGMRVEEGDHGFSFEGQEATDWLAKIGREPEYDENGEVVPVFFNTENMVAFLCHDDKCPDEASFQSPAQEIRERRFMDIDFFETEIIICRDEDISIPFLFRMGLVPEAKKGMPIRGARWLVGSL